MSSAVAICGYSYSSFDDSIKTSLIIPMDNMSSSAIDRPICLHRSRYTAVLYSLSIAR